MELQFYTVTDGLKFQLQRFDEAGVTFIDWPPQGENEHSWLPGIPPNSPQWLKDFTNR